jgi:HAD superfamily hydrolase (TIGR01509 family)
MSHWSADWHPRAVVFDLDGLMVNTEELYQDVGAELLRRRGKPWEGELLDAMMGRPARVALKIMIDWHQLDATVDELAQETSGLFADILATRLACMPGLLDLLAALEQAKLPKAIATSSGPQFAHKVLAQLNLVQRFQFILTCDDIVEGKPHPEIYLKAAERFDLPPAELLILEDSFNGCQAAINSGAFAVAVPGGHSHRHDFSAAALVIDTLADRRLYRVLGIDAPA